MFVTYTLQREAAWRNASKEYVGNVWGKFQRAFLDKYIPFTIREDMANELDMLPW